MKVGDQMSIIILQISK